MDIVHFMVFVGGIIGVIGAIGWAVSSVISVRRGHPFESGQAVPVTRATELLTQENEALRGKVSRLEERLSVLERIATDPSTRLDREIESLR